MTPAHRAATVPGAGDWIVAVWRTDTAPAFAAGNFRQPTSLRCYDTPVQEMVSSLSFTRMMVGGGLFDLDGDLLAVILPCREHIAAIAVASIQSMLERADTIEQRLLGRYGLELGPLSEEERRYFKTTNGLLVREVWTGYIGDAAGFRPGDIVTGLSGQAVITDGRSSNPDDTIGYTIRPGHTAGIEAAEDRAAGGCTRDRFGPRLRADNGLILGLFAHRPPDPFRAARQPGGACRNQAGRWPRQDRSGRTSGA